MKKGAKVVFHFGVFLIGLCIFPFLALADKNLAKVNGENITERDLKFYLVSFTEGQKDGIIKDPALRGQILQKVIDQELLFQEFQNQKMKLDQNSDYQDALKQFQRQWAINDFIEKKINPQINAENLKKFFEGHRSHFSTAQVRVQQILLPTLEEARKVLVLAQDAKNNFQDLAEKYSKDPQVKSTRGELGFMGRDRFDPEFMDVAFSTPEGQVASEPVETLYGFHVLKVIKKISGRFLELDEVEKTVRVALQRELLKNAVQKIKNNSKIQLF